MSRSSSREFLDGDYFLDVESLGPGEAVFRTVENRMPPGWLAYRAPLRCVQALEPNEVWNCVEAASSHAESGGFAAGFIGYEAASSDPVLVTKEAAWPVLAWFALYDGPPRLYRELAPCYSPVEAGLLRSEVDEEHYRTAFCRVKAALAQGNSYQVNLTFRLRFELQGSPAQFFASRCGVRPANFASFIRGDSWTIASFSPELFFERFGHSIRTQPMKGTALAPASRLDEESAKFALSSDPKSIAENVMIVDMVRNDLGSFCDVGSIGVDHLLQVERHGGLLQMTSGVTGRSRIDTTGLLRALFPPASVTGAPKVETMRLIRDLEWSPRHVYCGALGTMAPSSQRFSVGIRTALLKGPSSGRFPSGEFGVGSGIVWDSDCESEFAECLAKGESLRKAAEQWHLVEALSAQSVLGCERSASGGINRGQPSGEGLRDIDDHLTRLEKTAGDLGIPVDVAELKRRLLALDMPGMRVTDKIRVAVRRDGGVEISSGPSAVQTAELSVELASRPVWSDDPNLRIKTSSRAVFDRHLDEHPNADEVLLYNERMEITEFCRGNALVELDGKLCTPFSSSGCLDGVRVGQMVDAGTVVRRKILVHHLDSATKLFFVNSVAGIIPAVLTSKISLTRL